MRDGQAAPLAPWRIRKKFRELPSTGKICSTGQHRTDIGRKDQYCCVLGATLLCLLSQLVYGVVALERG
jgi:hypothetical protein